MNRALTMLQHARAVTAVEVACGKGAYDGRCRDGPEAFRQAYDTALKHEGIKFTWRRMPASLCADDIAPLAAVSQTARWTADLTGHLITSGDRFVVIGGNHSCAIGTWSGVADAIRSQGPLGLVWIDAHMDMHTPETTHSGAINGMPVASLLGHGAPELTAVAETGPALASKSVCLVATRSFEPEEADFARRADIRVIGMDEVHRRGIDASLLEAQTIATTGTAGYGVSLDLDAFDPVDAPGVGTPAPDGIRAADFLAPWSRLVRDPRCLAIEIVEYNPARDLSGRTARVMHDMISAWA